MGTYRLLRQVARDKGLLARARASHRRSATIRLLFIATSRRENDPTRSVQFRTYQIVVAEQSLANLSCPRLVIRQAPADGLHIIDD